VPQWDALKRCIYCTKREVFIAGHFAASVLLAISVVNHSLTEELLFRNIIEGDLGPDTYQEHAKAKHCHEVSFLSERSPSDKNTSEYGKLSFQKLMFERLFIVKCLEITSDCCAVWQRMTPNLQGIVAKLKPAYAIMALSDCISFNEFHLFGV
jgi:hypothetical protein